MLQSQGMIYNVHKHTYGMYNNIDIVNKSKPTISLHASAVRSPAISALWKVTVLYGKYHKYCQQHEDGIIFKKYGGISFWDESTTVQTR